MLKIRRVQDIRVNPLLVRKCKIVKIHPNNDQLFIQNMDGLIAKLDTTEGDQYNLDLIKDVLFGINHKYSIKWIVLE